MNVVLFIDTTNRDKVIVRLTVDQTISEKEQETIDRKNQALLPLIEEILQEHSLTVQNLTAIEVNPGPGSFTGIRVGIAVAHALGYALNIPVNGQLFSDNNALVDAIYS